VSVRICATNVFVRISLYYLYSHVSRSLSLSSLTHTHTHTDGDLIPAGVLRFVNLPEDVHTAANRSTGHQSAHRAITIGREFVCRCNGEEDWVLVVYNTGAK